MGSDNIFQRSRRRANKKLRRSKEKRDPYSRILIVCEGEKTEPNYLNEIIDELKLNTANIEIDGSCDSSPDKIWQYAKKRYNEEKKRGDCFDKVYCVFDKDSHTTYQGTVQAIGSARPNQTYSAVTSIPCFEYWVLLHFEPTTMPFNRAGSNSPCDCVMDKLKNYMPDYSKGSKTVFKQIMDSTNFAIANSKRTLNEAQQVGTDNPTTLMHELIEDLYQLKN